jgi:hypothetical protein
MGIKDRYVRVLVAIVMVLFLAQALTVTASALDVTGWDFDFNVTPSTVTPTQNFDITVHVYYWGKDSSGHPYTADAPGETVRITSTYFNTIQKTDDYGYLNNTDHIDVPGEYIITAEVIFRAETKTKTQTVSVNYASAATPLPEVNMTDDIAGDEVNTSDLNQTLVVSPEPNETATVTPAPYVVTPATATPEATPVPTPSPSGFLTLLGTVAVLGLAGLVAGKKQ